ncbi:MAG TPA: Fic family protein [Thermoanaerobaculia bacterium]|nr:Fic family protein [Thermoanaerobaculia bacterium]
MPPWRPRYSLTPGIARGLMEIEAARVLVEHVSLPPTVQAELRRRARVRSTHYSTRIEGNRLTLAEAERVIEGRRVQLHGRERDVGEVRHYWNAHLRVEEWAERGAPLTKELVRRLHALVESGRARPTPYRTGQNSIRDSETGAIVYLPPEAKDVPELMASFIDWERQAREENLPVPIIASLAHYQFVSIHPYYDGNGRTARLLATFLLHRGGYGLKGLFSLEERHARDLAAYYSALRVHPHHNYYEGPNKADLTQWLEYAVDTLAAVFVEAKEEALRHAAAGIPEIPEALRQLDARARVVLGLFSRQERVTAPDVASALGLSDRMARVLLKEWVDQGWIRVADPSRRARSYDLSAIYRQFIGSTSAMPSED